MHRRRRIALTATTGTVLLVASLLAVGGPAAALGSVTEQGPAPIHFLHMTLPLSQVAGASSPARPAAQSVSGRALRRESALARQLVAHRPGFAASGPAVAAKYLPQVASVRVRKSQGLINTWDALNQFDSRFSDGGNQFSAEPPDQGLCVSPGYVLEPVNSVVQIYSTDGQPLLPGQPGIPGAGPVGVSVNQFFGLAHEITRPSGPFGPGLSDPVCQYDPELGRWFVTVTAYDFEPTTGALSGPSSILVAVSTSPDPTGTWNVWSIDTTDNGTGGTPDHGCSSGFCFADYPQTGLDANGFYITTDEFDNIGNGEFHATQIYALSKQDLAAGDPTPASVFLQNIQSSVAGYAAYTLVPANGLPGDWDQRAGGTMYFGMSLSPYANKVVHRVSLFALSNTSSLSGASPSLSLSEIGVKSEGYAFPHQALQRRGPTPLLHCVNLGAACIGTDYPQQAGPVPIDSGIGKIYGAWISGGSVYLTTGTAVAGSGGAKLNTSDGTWRPINQRAAVAYFALQPDPTTGSVGATMIDQGYIAVSGANLIYPSIAVSTGGTVAVGATMTGPAVYPSAVYTTFPSGGSPTSVRVAGAGVGPYDGDSGTFDGGLRPRWGDYGYATASPDGSLWLAAEYVNQRCSFVTFASDTTCGGTRSPYANWGTRVFHVAG